MIDVSKLTLGKYIDYLQLRKEDRNNRDEIIKIFTSLDKDEDILVGLYSCIEHLTTLPSPIPLKAFELDGDLYTALDLQDFKFGTLLDIVDLVKSVDNIIEVAPNILEQTFLKCGWKDVDVNKRVDKITDLPLNKALNCMFYLDCMFLNILETYKDVFKTLPKKEVLKSLPKYITDELVMDVCDSDLVKLETIKTFNIHTVFQFLDRKQTT